MPRLSTPWRTEPHPQRFASAHLLQPHRAPGGKYQSRSRRAEPEERLGYARGHGYRDGLADNYALSAAAKIESVLVKLLLQLAGLRNRAASSAHARAVLS